MKFLKYNFHKLIVASFILSVPNIQGDEAIKISTRETSYEPVSYTHLDVYKRQIKDPPQ